MYKLSVIIPVYNAENTLNRAVDSILNQKWDGNVVDDIEIILVDDCSTDKSKLIMENYLRNFPNIKVLTTESNTGLPSIPRNIGIVNADSNYLMFMDNDDEYCKDICQRLYETIIKKDVDIVSCDWGFIKNSKFHKMQFNIDSNGEYFAFNSFDAISRALEINDWMIWKNIFKKSLLLKNDIKFPHTLCEDTFFMFEVFLNMNQMIYIKNLFGLKKYVKKDSICVIPDPHRIVEYLDCFIEFDSLLYSFEDIKKNYNYRFDFFSANLNSTLVKIIKLDNSHDINICLDKLYECEKKIQYDNSVKIHSIYDLIIKIINYFILKNQRKLTILLIKFCKFSFKVITSLHI